MLLKRIFLVVVEAPTADLATGVGMAFRSNSPIYWRRVIGPTARVALGNVHQELMFRSLNTLAANHTGEILAHTSRGHENPSQAAECWINIDAAEHRVGLAI